MSNHKLHSISHPYRQAIGVFCEDSIENWPGYNASALYVTSFTLYSLWHHNDMETVCKFLALSERTRGLFDIKMQSLEWKSALYKDNLATILHFYNDNPYIPKTVFILTHWGRVTHICVGKLIIIGSDNGLSPDRRQAIIWTNAPLLSIGPLRTYFNENLIKIQQFPLKKMHVKMSSVKWRPSCLGLNVLTQSPEVHFKYEMPSSW